MDGARRAGDVPGIEFTDTEVQAGMAALIAVRDPIDTSSSTPGAHGSGFDRVGAFQAGYLNGTGRCTELIDSPLPLVPNEFSEQNADPADRNPDAPFEDSSPDIKDGIFTIVAADLNTYWPLVFESTETPFPVLVVEAAADPANVGCADLESVEESAGYCQADGTVYYDESFMRELYDQFGDFGVGYVLGTAWSDAAQDLLESPFSDEPRSLLNDCLTGSWVRTILPDENDETSPTATARIEPGDLDEAVQTTLLIGDATADEDIAGTAFEKIDNFRDGALNGLEACSERIPD
ncbi:MAG: neutral zinc metallopeptidase [Ilumatobacteraceae bacterium]